MIPQYFTDKQNNLLPIWVCKPLRTLVQRDSYMCETQKRRAVSGLDDVDRAVLYFLSEDARHSSATDIAEHVRVSAQTVRN
ncbi:MAG: AsnC family transcriptional regulator, partial [Salinirussus sp.]